MKLNQISSYTSGNPKKSVQIERLIDFGALLKQIFDNFQMTSLLR